VRPTLTAAMRSSALARLADRRVFELSTRPPEILFPGARQSHDVKCFAVGHLVMSSQIELRQIAGSDHSPRRTKAMTSALNSGVNDRRGRRRAPFPPSACFPIWTPST
jgi:hypothetical protein